jgi:hypothetical protein
MDYLTFVWKRYLLHFTPDINECSSGTHNCHSDAICSNSKGSFNCICKDGYQGNGSYCEGMKYIFSPIYGNVWFASLISSGLFVFFFLTYWQTRGLRKFECEHAQFFLCLLTTLLLLKTLFSIATEYFTLPNLTTTTFLLFLKHRLSNTTNLFLTLDLKLVKNYNCSHNTLTSSSSI